MQSLENSSIPTSKRLGVSLNVDTGYNGKRFDTSPPRTPAAQDPHWNKTNITTPNRALNPQRQTFLDDITPIDPASNKDNDVTRGNRSRDSHDLSLSPRQVTRDSLVDHMLLSLDQFSFGQEGAGVDTQPTVEEEQLYSTFGDEESYQTTSNFAPRNGRIAHTYSYSSDYDQADDASRYSGPSRGRRSNSSSNFQSGLGRINSLRNEGAAAGFVSNRAPASIPPRGIHSRSGKGSKGSSANSFDLGYAQVTSNQRWAHGLAGRSSSFDYGKDHQGAMTSQLPAMSTQQSPTFDYEYDAAPTPTIPGGPRRFRPTSPVMIPQALDHPSPNDSVPPEPQRLERKRSTKSNKSAYAGKGTANPSGGGRVDYGLHDSTRELPPMPAFMKEPAPGPLVGYAVGYVKGKETPTQTPSTPQQSKDRPNFFRRVFGGSSRNNTVTPNTLDPPRSHGSTTSTETTNHPSSRTHHIANQMKSHSLPPPREPPPTPKETAPVLSKKPSSFFRRRKKSVAEPDPMPVTLSTPPILLQNEPDGRTGTSPVSSLRKVMNPYLRTPAWSPNDPAHQLSIDRQMNDSPELQRSVRGFSPDYEPDKNATIRAVRSNPQGTLSTAPSSSSSAKRPFLGVGPSGIDGTFLNDASDDGRSNASQSGFFTKEVPETEHAPVKAPSPVVQASTAASVKRDMALVAEYERTYSKNSSALRSDLGAPSPIMESPRSHTIPGELSPQFATANSTKDADWVILTPTKSNQPSEKEDRERDRVWLEPSSDEEDVNPVGSKLTLPSPTVRSSDSTDAPYLSATSLPVVQIEGENGGAPPTPELFSAAEAIRLLDDTAPTPDDCEKAKKIYDGNEDFIQKERAAAWMGDEGVVRSRTLIAYMKLYEFSNLNILAALRILCSKLVLKGESQQVDRILDAFAQRWCQCNPTHGFKVTGRALC
jgi:hypothetical protein